MASFTFKEDTPHGLAKRIVLYRIIQAEFPRGIYNRYNKCKGADFTYFDAFAGEGWYGTEAEIEEEDEARKSSNSPVHSDFTCPFGDRKMGSPLVALEAIYQHFSEMKKETMKESLKEDRTISLMIFEEKDKKRFQKLIENVLWFIESKNKGLKRIEKSDNNYLWEYAGQTGDGMAFYLAVQKKDGYAYEWIMQKEDKTHSIKIEFKKSSFQELDIDVFKNNEPMVTFFDPIGYTGIPMDKVQELFGFKRKILLNFMVQAINRFMAVETQSDNMRELFGDGGWKENLSEDFRSNKASKKMRELMNGYKACFRNACFDNCHDFKPWLVEFLNLSVRKRKETGYIYYLVYTATALSDFVVAKYALTQVSEKPALMLQHSHNTNDLELYFSDSQAMDHLRSQTKKEKNIKFECEAETIFNHWRGKKCSFGEVKKWILIDTPFEIHSKAFRILERKNLLEVISTDYLVRGNISPMTHSRKRKPFPPYVGVTESDRDPYCSETISKNTYCNAWELKFSNCNFDNSKSFAIASAGVVEDFQMKLNENASSNSPQIVQSANGENQKRKFQEMNEDETPYKIEDTKFNDPENVKRKLFN